jgi:hypothetical protein
MSLQLIAQGAFVFVVFWLIGDWKWPGKLVGALLRPFGFERVADLERLRLENERRSKP